MKGTVYELYLYMLVKCRDCSALAPGSLNDIELPGSDDFDPTDIIFHIDAPEGWQSQDQYYARSTRAICPDCQAKNIKREL